MEISKSYSIKEFTEHLNIQEIKNENLHIINFKDVHNIPSKSDPITIDFFSLTIKASYQINNNGNVNSSAYLFADCPQNVFQWEEGPPQSGYSILVSAKYLQTSVKEYNFLRYNHHEALYLAEDEEALMWDLFEKANDEFTKEGYSVDVVLSYVKLVFSYIKIYYDRQFNNRSTMYNDIIESFLTNMAHYFAASENTGKLPSVAYFAQKADLSANYFGDLIKHFTGEPPLEHIHKYVLQIAKEKLKNTSLSVSEISHSLGFDYPNYFAKFFRKKTGMSPRAFRTL